MIQNGHRVVTTLTMVRHKRNLTKTINEMSIAEAGYTSLTDTSIGVKIKLSSLWISLMLLNIYVDYFHSGSQE